MHQTSVARLVEDNRVKLGLQWLGGRGRALIERDPSESAATVGHLNLIHPNRIQVLGPHEDAHLRGLSREEMYGLISTLIAARPAAIIVADGLTVPEGLNSAVTDAGIDLLSTPQPAPWVIDKLRRYLMRELAETTERHGVFVDVLGVGVLITGDSSIGKSELGLELISRGHGLVADDVVEITRISASVLEGRCPPLLKDFLEVRGLGVLNIRTVFGETAVRPRMILRLIVRLERPANLQTLGERLPLHELSEEVLGVTISKVVIPVAAGRNLAVLLEAAVRNWVMKQRGLDSTAEFIQRQHTALYGASDGSDVNASDSAPLKAGGTQ
jgi:HPr kinase/phosphorylase